MPGRHSGELFEPGYFAHIAEYMFSDDQEGHSTFHLTNVLDREYIAKGQRNALMNILQVCSKIRTEE
jgi:hypothetical protein